MPSQYRSSFTADKSNRPANIQSTLSSTKSKLDDTKYVYGGPNAAPKWTMSFMLCNVYGLIFHCVSKFSLSTMPFSGYCNSMLSQENLCQCYNTIIASVERLSP